MEAAKSQPTDGWRALQDSTREARQLALAPRGALAAVADSLGRVMLLDYAPPFAAVRLWKGYRDATVAWLDCPSGVPAAERRVLTKGPALAGANLAI